LVFARGDWEIAAGQLKDILNVVLFTGAHTNKIYFNLMLN
jgi:hypothetical protein